MIREVLAAAFLASLSGCAIPSAPTADQVDLASQKAREAADLLFQRLSAELGAAMAKGGPAASILVCKDRAPAIAAEIEASTGVDIERTALRVRNPANAPDDWETRTMESFSARRKAGEEWFAMTATRIDEQQVHWMRPIPLGGMCAACHGNAEAISPETRRALLKAYPADTAVGFSTGELRGAFTARVSLQPVRSP
jgi:hypothetical protein